MKRTFALPAFVCSCSLLLQITALLPAQEPAGETQTIRPGVTVTAVDAGATLHLKDKQTDTLSRGVHLNVARIDGDWIGVYDDSTGKRRAGWIHRRELVVVSGSGASAPPVIAGDAQQAIAALEKLGVELERTHDGAVESADASETALGDTHLALFQSFSELEELDLSKTAITDQGLSSLEKLKSLKRLYLSGTAISDQGMAYLGRMTWLQVLALDSTKLEGPGLEHLKGLTDLRALNLSNCPIEDEHLAPLANFTLLETLALEKAKIKGSGFVHLKPLKSLHVLNLNSCDITDEKAFTHLYGLGELRIIRMYDSIADDNELRKLKRELKVLAVFR